MSGPVDADEDWFGLSAAGGKAVVCALPGHLHVYAFAVAEVDVMVLVIQKGSRHANAEPTPSLRIGSAARKRQRAAFVFADRSRKEGHFRYALSWESCETNGLEMTRPQATVGHDAHVLFESCSLARGKSRTRNQEDARR
jgi:hypothetical protein